MSGLDIAFIFCASIGGFFVLLRIFLQFIGIDHDVDMHMDSDICEMNHSDTDSGFKILSFQGLAAFLLMFGLVGFAISRQANVSNFVTIPAAVAAGLGSAFIIAYLFKLGMVLQSSGNININSAIGCNGTVYLSIPSQGQGRITVNIKNRMVELDAVSNSEVEIPSGQIVKVVQLKGGVAVVEKL